MVNIPTCLNNLKTKVDELDIDKLYTVSVDLKSDGVGKDVVKNTKFNKLNPIVKSLENKYPNETTLIYINQYNTNEKKIDGKN